MPFKQEFVNQPNVVCSLMREISGKTAMPVSAALENPAGVC